VAGSKSGSRRRQLSRQREDIEKQGSRWHVSEHAYRDKEREERVEEERIPVVHQRFLASRGRGS
jgi:hypothetical protein